jgi:hypothetical protein
MNARFLEKLQAELSALAKSLLEESVRAPDARQRAELIAEAKVAQRACMRVRARLNALRRPGSVR